MKPHTVDMRPATARGSSLLASNDADKALAEQFAGGAHAFMLDVARAAVSAPQQAREVQRAAYLTLLKRHDWTAEHGPGASDFKPGDRVLYVPNHAHDDTTHCDCERGVVTSTNRVNVFVRYGNELHAKATSPENLVPDRPDLSRAIDLRRGA